jgi:hypothetical protein
MNSGKAITNTPPATWGKEYSNTTKIISPDVQVTQGKTFDKAYSDVCLLNLACERAKEDFRYIVSKRNSIMGFSKCEGKVFAYLPCNEPLLKQPKSAKFISEHAIVAPSELEKEIWFVVKYP